MTVRAHFMWGPRDIIWILQKAHGFDYFCFLKQLNISSNKIFFFLYSQGEYKLEKYTPPLSSPQLAQDSPQWLPKEWYITAVLYLRKPLSSAQNKRQHLAAEGPGLFRASPTEQCHCQNRVFVPKNQTMETGFLSTWKSCSSVQPTWP